MLQHYEGELGNFDYDDEEFEEIFVEGPHLHYRGKGLSVDLPEGCINTSYMFANCELPPGFSLGDGFDTSEVINMNHMFFASILPVGFSLGNKFDTSDVFDLSYMFWGCQMPEGFWLGEKFNTKNVKSMKGMFGNCTLPESFSLSNDFNISNVENVTAMFSFCYLPDGLAISDFNRKPEKIVYWLKSRKPIKAMMNASTDESKKIFEEQVATACEFIEDYFINGRISLVYRAINQMRGCGYNDDIIQQAMIKTIERIIQESTENSQDMQLF